MEESIKELLIKGKEDSYYMEKVINTFSPLIKSYSRKAGWKIETEDMESLLTIRLIEIVRTMKVLDLDGQNVKYISTGIRFHFLNILKKINNIQEQENFDLDKLDNTGVADKTDTVFDELIQSIDEKKREILTLKFKEMYTDQEIADKLNITRQAVNKQLRKAYQQILPYAK